MKVARFHITIIALFLFSSCDVVSLKQQGLYSHKSSTPEQRNIKGFTDLIIFDEYMDHTVWVSPETECVTMKKADKKSKRGNVSLELKWDKVGGGCKWIGLGFGWNNWQPKDLSQIIQEGAIALYLKSAKGTFKNFPVAFALEDYSGSQAYQGFNATMVKKEFNETSWNKVIIPLKGFPFKGFDCDPSNIKQFMIQLEGDGEVYIDHIEIGLFSELQYDEKIKIEGLEVVPTKK